MASKDAALTEFYEGLLDKFGKDSETKSLIKNHLDQLKVKPKISVADLDTVESVIKSHHSSKYSPSTTKSFYSSVKDSFRKPNQNHQKLSEFESSNQNRSVSFHQSKKKTVNLPSNSIFPTESPIDVQKSAEFWRIYSCLSPKRNPTDLDVWAKIQKADFIKYKNEQKLGARLKKLQQNEYRAYLDSQVKHTQRFKDQESLQNSLILPSSLKSDKKNSSWRQELDEMVEHKALTIQKNFKLQTEEDEKFLDCIKEDQKLDLKKIAEKKTKNKELSLDLLKDSEARRKKQLKKMHEARVHSRELMNERIDLMDSAETHQKIEMLNRIQWVHDDKRLQKLLPTTQKLRTDESESTSLMIGEVDSKRKQRMIEYHKVLLEQIKEKVERNNEELQERVKERERIRRSGLKGIREYEEEMVNKRNRERGVRSELDQQVLRKREKWANEMLFTDNEAKINKRIFESSLQVIERNKGDSIDNQKLEFYG